MKYLTQGKDGDQEAVAELRLHLRHAGEPDQRGIQRAAAAGAQGQQRGHQRRNARLIQTAFLLLLQETAYPKNSACEYLYITYFDFKLFSILTSYFY